MKNESAAIADRAIRIGPLRRSGAPASGQLHARIVEEIGSRIVTGGLQPGDRLPSAADWAAALGVSLTAFRESIKALAGKGLIEARPKTGMRVRARQFWNHLDGDILSWRFRAGGDPAALFELRRLVEPAAAELAAQRADDAQIGSLEAAYRGMAAAGDDGELFAGPDLEFHRLILGMTGNDLIGALAALIETALAISFRLSNDNPDGQSPSLPLHREVLDAIAGRDGREARAAMERLLVASENDVRKAARARRRKKH